MIKQDIEKMLESGDGKEALIMLAEEILELKERVRELEKKQ